MRTIQQTAVAWLTSRFEGVPPRLHDDEPVADLVARMAGAEPALRHLARVIDGAAAPERFDVLPESAGLRAVFEGLDVSRLEGDEAGMRAAAVCDALLEAFRWRSARGDDLEVGPLFDPASGLPNRLLFLDRLTQAIAYAHRHDTLLGVCSMRLGLAAAAPGGGRVVLEIATRLRDTIRGLDTIARLGFDEFGVVLNDLPSRDSALVAASKIDAVFEQPFEIGGRERVLAPRIGLAFYPAHGHDAPMLLAAAREAVQDAAPLAVFGEP